jgi:hypothetical protein
MRYTWRKGNPYNGMARMPDTYRLQFGGEELAIAQRIGRFGDEWFWYGDGVNTCRTPKPLEEVKIDAVEHFRQKVATDTALR